MKRKLAIVAIGVVLLLGLSGNVRAEENGYVRYELECGTVCFDFGEWGYCQDSCEEGICPTQEGRAAETPTDTDSPEATESPVPNTETPTPNSEPTPSPFATPKSRCNQGRGNGDDGCSPGNSDHRHDPNDPQRGPRQ